MNDDIPMHLPIAYPYDPGMQRRERSWTLMAGSRRLSFTRVDHYAVSQPFRVTAHHAQARRWSLTGAVAVVLGSVAGLATLGLAMNASRAASGAYMLSVAVPAGTPFQADRPRSPQTRTMHRRPAPMVPPMPAPVAAASDDDAAYATASAPARLEGARPAIDAALSSGALQQWTSVDGAERGFVVAGPVDQGCRTLSILTRRDGDDKVETRRECAAATGGGTAAP
jgi:type IV secretory pathway VirB10-like protein